ncbi:DMT family transporter [Ostreiculturibacter nitratireducens]|uniref:DMT family transporter n=1 Tax=Ostreiculturibacter nitratireducens TaxID=3075226 RepID=UPI0031B5E5C4
MPEWIRYGVVMLAAGIGIPVLAALNAQLGGRLGSPAAAATILFVVAFVGAATVLFATGRPAALAALPGQPKHLFLAGLLVAFYVLSITWVAPRFGVGNAVFFVLLGQLISAAAIDHFGLMGAMVKPLTLSRGGGILLMAAGVLLTQRA